MKVLAVYNMKGGVGKSTTAVNLAYLSAASGARTLLWDLDAQGASSFAFRVQQGVAGFGKKALQRVDPLADAIKATDYDNLDLLPADFAYRKLDRFLERLARPDQGLVNVLQQLGRAYALVILDCPPGFSLLTENILGAADIVLVPTIPTVLSLRTLARLVTFVERRPIHGRLMAFLSLVDRRKSLHRRIVDWAIRHPEFFFPVQVPYATNVEQMSVRRLPLSVASPQDPAASAFEALWTHAWGLLAESSGPDTRDGGAFVGAIADLIAGLGGEGGLASVSGVPSRATPAAPATDARPAQVHRFTLAAPGEEVFASLARELSVVTPSPAVPQLAHFFDTEDGVLRRSGFVVQLVEEPRRFYVVVDRPGPPPGSGADNESMPSVQIDGRWAAEILSGGLSPITVLERRLGHPLPEAVGRAAGAVGDRPLRRVAWRKRLRRTLGPVVLPFEGTALELLAHVDTVTSPDGQVGHDIEITVTGGDPRAVEGALRQLLSRVGVEWRPATVRRWLTSAPRRQTGTAR